MSLRGWWPLARALAAASICWFALTSVAIPRASHSLNPTKTFTTQKFSNAPNAIVKVVAARRLPSGVWLVTWRFVGCSKPVGPSYSYRVTHANGVAFTRGEYLLSGAMYGRHDIQAPSVGAVRKLSKSERKAMCESTRG